MEGAAGEVLRVGFQQDWTPGGAELLGLRAEDLERSLEALWAASDLLITNSPPLRDKLAGRGVESTLLPYGFSLELADRYDDPCPPELAGLPRPLLGYTGSIDGRLDVGALEAVSERFADGTVLLVGPIHPRLAPDALDSLTVRSNVRIVGRQPREAIPAYLAQLDCALLPYGRSEWLEVQAPLKVWEYLYAGCPIVGSGNPSLRAFPPPLLRFVGPGEDFAAAVAQALAEGRSHANERRAFAAANSWEKRALELERLVEERMKKGASFRRPARS
jgi:glycosyltransferase involved in cell wall biosynthesis